MRKVALAISLLLVCLTSWAQCWQWVDPRIGSVGVGRTFPGPCMPFGMVKPGPDCGVLPNAGWAPLPAAVSGFSQTHVSGTGGGQKYGNILLQPFVGDGQMVNGERRIDFSQKRIDETIALGYYATTFESGVRTEITTSERCAYYRFHYPPLSNDRGEPCQTVAPPSKSREEPCQTVAPPNKSREEPCQTVAPPSKNREEPCQTVAPPSKSREEPCQTVVPPSKNREEPCQTVATLWLDATHFLGKDTVPDLRERQQFVGGEVELVSDHEVQGYSRIRGGWNNGDAYTVYFCLQTDKAFQPFPQPLPEDKGRTTAVAAQCPTDRSGAVILQFSDTLVNVKVGISYVSTMQARRNISNLDFDEQLALLRDSWEQQLSKIQIAGTDQQRRMFYTALYHTMLMPIDKTGENPKWADSPYYDDYYAIWDTYRTSSPLLTLLWPERQVAVVNSLLNIYTREGYLPDARSGDCNGRTQGGSNAEVVIADAFVKGLGRPLYCDAVAVPTNTIDYPLALEAMLKDAEADPGADHEKHGRGGLNEYRRLGYIPYGIPRAGTRTIEYAYDDYCLAQVARGLGHTDIYEEYLSRSSNWRNLWRSDYEWDDVRGYILPRDADGRWMDSVPWGRSKVFHPLIPYTPVTKVAPWYLPWWDTFFYEALSAEYSLSIPHDVPGLIEACGGPDAFRRRLDLFFERGRYNVGNEPSFLTPCLYHWLRRPDLSTRRIHQIIRDNYSDRPDGLPGNDDGGAMSSWLAFHMMGLYPNAGQDYYLLNLPLLSEYTFQLSNGKRLRVRNLIPDPSPKERGADRLAAGTFRVHFNGRELTDARITHQELMEGGELVFSVSYAEPLPALQEEEHPKGGVGAVSSSLPSGDGGGVYQVSFTLNRQFRTWPLSFRWEKSGKGQRGKALATDTLVVTCKQTTYRIPRSEAEGATGFCWLNPQQDGTVYHNAVGTFLFISTQAIRQLQEQGFFRYDGITWRRSKTDGWVQADIDGTEMHIDYDAVTGLYLVTEMRHNPLGIDWKLVR